MNTLVQEKIVMEKILFCWSGGKDSARALFEVRKSGNFEIAALVTTVTSGYERISMHGVRETLLEKQVEAIGLPLEKIYISPQASNDEYEQKMKEALESFREKGVRKVAFGDIFLEDLKKYREENLSRISMEGLFPIWKRDSHELAQTFIALGFKAVITCVDSHVLDKSFAGRDFDEAFLKELPPSVDPCGENGEFHSFVYGGPIFKTPVLFKKGDVIIRDKRFYFCDLIPVHKEK